MIEYSQRNIEGVVDAIENGKIVKVSEDYAKREGLLVLRRAAPIIEQSRTQRKEDETRKNKGFIGMEDLRKPLSSKNNELLRELVENFHWILVQKRKARVLTRKKVADAIGETELSVKMIENGVLPVNNFVLVNKLESYYGVNLRKNKTAASSRPLRQIIDFNKSQTTPAPRWIKRGEKKETNAIELLDDDSGDEKTESAERKKADSEDIDIEQL